MLTRDNASGPFAEEWKKAYGEISKEVEEFDIANALSAAALSVKDEHELVSRHHPNPIALQSRSLTSLALYTKCVKGLHASHDRILCRGNVGNSG